MKRMLQALALAAAVLVCAGSIHAQMRAHFINVGQAESILLEMPKAAVLIDAGGECTCDDRDKAHLLEYIDQFFKRRTDLKKTIHTVIISHPHIDHTALLMDVMRKYKVLNLVDGGDDGGSGIVPLYAARWYAQKEKIKYFSVADKNIGKDGLVIAPLKELNDADQRVDLRLLSGSRGCRNRNNDTLVTLASYRGVKFLFTGDAEALEEEEQDCTPELTHLLERYKGTPMLDVDVYKVGHHGSFNGTSEAWLTAMTPKISVISAGDHTQQGPGQFHAWQFGHPREAAVKTIEKFTSLSRDQTLVVTMDKVMKPHPNRPLKKAVYCTCWDDDVVVEVGDDGKLNVP